MDYKFIYDNKEFALNHENCDGIFFDQDNEVTGLTLDIILEALNEGEEVNFTKEYYSGKCSCDMQEKVDKYYGYLEYHFYVYTKNNEYVINTLCKEYETTSFNKLLSLGNVDASYIVNIIVCPHCDLYSIDVEQCEV